LLLRRIGRTTLTHTTFGMATQNRLTLAFTDRALESAFVAHMFARTLQQGRTAIVVAVLVYLLFGVFDAWWFPPEHRAYVWAIRLAALSVPIVVFALTYGRWFKRAPYASLASVGLAGGFGLIGMFALMPIEAVTQCFASMLLVTFFTYNLVGTRFIYALWVDVILLLIFVMFIVSSDYPIHASATHLFFIVSANLIGGAAGYLTEYQHRQLFLRQRELDEQRLRHFDRSLHDALTGLPNRELLHERVEQALSRSNRDGLRHAGLFIDLDGFKQINDHFGHEVGDRTVRAVANRLQAAVRDVDTVARLGGDEFFVLIYGISTADNALAKANALLTLIKAPLPGMPDEFVQSASIGICLFPYPSANVDDIIRRADQAMYNAKEAGKDQCFVANGE
jgi:diguanylate cyclase (GGDEF)-like protein